MRKKKKNNMRIWLLNFHTISKNKFIFIIITFKKIYKFLNIIFLCAFLWISSWKCLLILWEIYFWLNIFTCLRNLLKTEEFQYSFAILCFSLYFQFWRYIFHFTKIIIFYSKWILKIYFKQVKFKKKFQKRNNLQFQDSQ